MKTRKLALCALLTALALALSYAESFLPPTLLIPVPGVKLGLPNLVTLAALYLLGLPYAGVISFARCFLGAFYASGPVSLWFSLCGAALSLLVMWGLKVRCTKRVSLWGVSLAGAAAHNLGQVCAASLILRTTAIFTYLPVMLLASLVTGSVIAAIAAPVIALLDKLTVLR